MKLTDPDRVYLLGRIVAAFVPLKPTRTPPARDGSSKEATVDFATACWSLKYLRSLEYVLEKEEEPKASSAVSSDADRIPF